MSHARLNAPPPPCAETPPPPPADKIPMKRCGLISEIAALVAFIVSKDCSFTTGFCFDATCVVPPLNSCPPAYTYLSPHLHAHTARRGGRATY